MAGYKDRLLTRSFTTKPFLTGPTKEKWVIKSVVVVSYGNDETKTVVLWRRNAIQHILPVQLHIQDSTTHFTRSFLAFLSAAPLLSPPSILISSAALSKSSSYCRRPDILSGILYGCVMSYDSVPEASSVCLLQNVPYQFLLMVDGERCHSTLSQTSTKLNNSEIWFRRKKSERS